MIFFRKLFFSVYKKIENILFYILNIFKKLFKNMTNNFVGYKSDFLLKKITNKYTQNYVNKKINF